MRKLFSIIVISGLGLAGFSAIAPVHAADETPKCVAETKAVQDAKAEHDQADASWAGSEVYAEKMKPYKDKIAAAEKALETCKAGFIQPPAATPEPVDPKGCAKATAEYDMGVASGATGNDLKRLEDAKKYSCGEKPKRSDNNWGNTDGSAWEDAAKKAEEARKVEEAKKKAYEAAKAKCGAEAEKAAKKDPVADVDYWTVWEKCMSDAGFSTAKKTNTEKEKDPANDRTPNADNGSTPNSGTASDNSSKTEPSAKASAEKMQGKKLAKTGVGVEAGAGVALLSIIAGAAFVLRRKF